jgi:uncharacterized membrane protein
MRLPAVALIAALVAAPAAAEARAPVVHQLVVFKSGKTKARGVSSKGVLVKVGQRRCAAGTGTALAALVRSKPGRLRLRDFGSCSKRARDGAGLFVSGIGRDRNHGQNGWTYKVGRKAATAGAADPAGPFGKGRRLRQGQRVTWFYCRLVGGGCQRTLELKAAAEPGGVATTVRGYDDRGHGVAVAEATVKLGAATRVTDPSGVAHFGAAPGSYKAYASKKGFVRSFSERVVVR